MKMMASGVGNLTRDAELSYTNSGTALCKFSIACNERMKDKEDQVHYFDCVIWGNFGETMSQYLKKGQKVAVCGALKQNRWQDKDTGQNRSSYSINVSELELCGAKSQAQDGGYDRSAGQYQGNAGNSGVPTPPPVDDFEDDLPF